MIICKEDVDHKRLSLRYSNMASTSLYYTICKYRKYQGTSTQHSLPLRTRFGFATRRTTARRATPGRTVCCLVLCNDINLTTGIRADKHAALAIKRQTHWSEAIFRTSGIVRIREDVCVRRVTARRSYRFTIGKGDK